MQKLRIKRQSNCIWSDTVHLGHPVINRPPVQSIDKSKTQNRGNSKLLGRTTFILFNVPPHIFTIFQIFQRSVEPCHWQATIQLIKFVPVPIYLELSIILFIQFLLFLMTILEAKKFKMQTFFFFFESVNNKHTLFELVSRWSVHQHPPRERLHPRRETWLRTVERTSASSQMQSQSKNTKKYKKELDKLKTWKGGLGSRECPGGLKTRKGGPGKNQGF